jgi:hypothetical protein
MPVAIWMPQCQHPDTATEHATEQHATAVKQLQQLSGQQQFQRLFQLSVAQLRPADIRFPAE